MSDVALFSPFMQMPGCCLEEYLNRFLHVLSSSLFISAVYVYVTFAFDIALLKNI
jgi:hypothetical protein